MNGDFTMTDIFIIGNGPAGISAAIYAVRAGLSVKVAGKDAGALGKTDKIENYYGFPESVTGKELHDRGISQAKRLGAEISECEVFDIEYSYADTSADPSSEQYINHFRITTSAGVFTSKALILAAGTSRRAPAITGLRDHEGRGVSYCAVCDAFFYRDQPVSVIGSGDYALSEALHLVPTSSEVVILTDGKDFISEKFSLNADAIEAARTGNAGAFMLPDDITAAVAGGTLRFDSRRITEIKGDPVVSSVVFSDGDALETSGVFIALGTASASDLARKLGVTDGDGKLVVNEDLSTFVPGFFAAGDCTGGMLQVAKAVYDGARAGTSAVKFIRSI